MTCLDHRAHIVRLGWCTFQVGETRQLGAQPGCSVRGSRTGLAPGELHCTATAAVAVC